MDSTIIEAGKVLVQELGETHPSGVLCAIAIGQREQSANYIENLIATFQGYADGSNEDQARLTKAACAVLSEITKLRAALSSRGKHGLPETDLERFIKDYLRGSAPRLFDSAENLREAIER